MAAIWITFDMTRPPRFPIVCTPRAEVSVVSNRHVKNVPHVAGMPFATLIPVFAWIGAYAMHSVDDQHSPGSTFYRAALRRLRTAKIPFLVGGAYALEVHTGIVRRTKDFDI